MLINSAEKGLNHTILGDVMKKTVCIVFGSAFLHLCICIIEWLLWNFIHGMNGFDGYNLYEKLSFLLLFTLTVMSVFSLIRGENAIANAIIFWLTFAFFDRIIALRILIAELTDNSYVYTPNFLGDDIWAVCYMGCIIATIITAVVIMFKNINK